MPELPLYTAIEILPEPLTGGTTRPFLAVATNGDDTAKFVLKPFGKKHAAQRCYTGAEAFAHHIAWNLDLCVPDAAFVEIPSALIEVLMHIDQKSYNDLMSRDPRPCFATKYLGHGLPTFSPTVARRHIELHNLESIYAFDALILNEDRKRTKPNILKTSNNYYLIDHEKAFEGSSYVRNELLPIQQLPGYMRNHLFHRALKRELSKGNVNFQTFEYYFSLFRIETLIPIKNQLSSFQYNTDECEAWIDYLQYVSENVNNFVAGLRNSLV